MILRLEAAVTHLNLANKLINREDEGHAYSGLLSLSTSRRKEVACGIMFAI